MLGQVLGDVLPPAIGIALSPVPIIAAVLMLLSPRASRTAPAFAAGWLGGILVVASAVLLFVPQSAATDTGAGAGAGWLRLVMGLLFLFLAAGQWRSRPRPGEASKLPKWMTGIDTMGPGAAVGLGAALSALNPKNLPLALAAGLSLAQVDGTGDAIVGLVVFVVLAGAGVLVPVVGYLLMRQRMAPALTVLKDWLSHNNATVMFVVLLIMGVVQIGNGLSVVTS